MSEVGVQQGDPLGPMGYRTSTHKLLQAVQTDYAQWDLDDGALGGLTDELIQAVNTVRIEDAKIACE